MDEQAGAPAEAPDPAPRRPHLVDSRPPAMAWAGSTGAGGARLGSVHVPMGRLDGEVVLALAGPGPPLCSGELRLTEAQNAPLPDVRWLAARRWGEPLLAAASARPAPCRRSRELHRQRLLQLLP